MMELLKTKLEQVAVHRDIATVLRAVQELPDLIARKGDGAAAMWGPDGGDLFEQMSRPICARVSDMMKPIQEEMQELRDMVAGDSGGANFRLDAGSRANQATMARAAARSARVDVGRANEESQSTLQGWTQGLRHIADWVHIGGPSQPPPSRKDGSALEGSERRAVIAGALAEPANDLVLINENLADGSIVSLEGGRARPPTITITASAASAVSTSDITSLKSEMEDFGGSFSGSPAPLRAAEQATTRNGAYGLEPNKGRRPLPAQATSTTPTKEPSQAKIPASRPSAQNSGPYTLTSRADLPGDRHAGKPTMVTEDRYGPILPTSVAPAKDVSQAKSSAIRPSAQSSGPYPLTSRGEPPSLGDRQSGRPNIATDDKYGPRPRAAGRGKEADVGRLPTRSAADRPPYDVDNPQQSSQPALSRRAAMPQDKSGRGGGVRSAQESGRGARVPSSGYGPPGGDVVM
jgi:hypothetical protein